MGIDNQIVMILKKINDLIFFHNCLIISIEIQPIIRINP